MEPVFSANNGAGMPVPMRGEDDIIGLEQRLDDGGCVRATPKQYRMEDDDSAVMRAYEK